MLTTSPLFGVSLFASSAAVVKWYNASLVRKNTRSLSSDKHKGNTDEPSYEKVLERLFNYSTPRSRPRTHDELSAEFLVRQAFFDHHYHILLTENSSSTPFPPQAIHVTGTKGKGSTCELIGAALRGEGHRVGVFSSPHLHTACERIKINSTIISREEFLKLGIWAMNCMKTEKWAVFFDVLLLMALRYFVEQGVDYLVLEVGIGGRYDSTNFMINPATCVITNVSLDHQGMLGNTIADIAWQKAGIIKEGTPVFVPSCLHSDALEVVRNECKLKDAPLNIVHFEADEIESLMKVVGMEKDNFPTEIENICLSTEVCRHLGVGVKGMKDYYWPCRMETFDLSKVLKPDSSHEPVVVIDGSHNALSVDLCVRGLRRRYAAGNGFDLWVAFGSGKDKNLESMLEAVMKSTDRMIATVSKHFRAQDAQGMIAKVLPQYENKLFHPSETAVSSLGTSEGKLLKNGNVAARLTWAISEARKRSRNQSGQRVVIAVCGSLFVAAEAREYLFSAYPSLFSRDDWVRSKDDEIPMSTVPAPGSGRQSVRKSLRKAHENNT